MHPDRRAFVGGAAALLLPGATRARTAASGTAANDLALVAERVRVRACARPRDMRAVAGFQSGLRPGGSWDEIDYADKSDAAWSPQTHLLRLRDMAAAHACAPASDHLAASIRRAYAFWIERDPQSANWWHNQIGVPELLGEILLLASPLIDAEERAAGVEIMKRAYRPRDQGEEGGNTGANRLWRAGIGIHRAVAAGDPALADESFRAIEDAIFVAGRPGVEGVQPDGSFHQHGPQLYNLSYGHLWAGESLRWTAVATGTRFAMRPGSERLLIDYLLDGAQWFTHGLGEAFAAEGRTVSRDEPSAVPTVLLSQAELALTLEPHRRPELQALIKRVRAAEASGRASERLALVGHKHFWRSDMSVHHRPGWSAFVKTSSPRTSCPETGNGEGLKNLHLADGFTQIMRTGREYDSIQPVWDWRRLPGTTTERRAYPLKPEQDWGAPGTSDFAAGVSDGRCGATGFHYDRLGVSARKCWFFFDDCLLALGAGVDAPGAASPVVTTINQALLAGPVTVRAASGGPRALERGGPARVGGLLWAHHDGIGYVMLEGPVVATVQAGPRTGSWRAINSRYDHQLVTRDLFDLLIDHGARPAAARYAYVVVPGVDVAGVERFRAAPSIRVVHNDAAAQAVSHVRLGVHQIVFHAPARVALGPGLELAADRQAIVMLRHEKGRYKLSAACPDPAATSLEVELFAGGAVRRAALPLPLPGGAMSGSTVSRVLAIG